MIPWLAATISLIVLGPPPAHDPVDDDVWWESIW